MVGRCSRGVRMASVPLSVHRSPPAVPVVETLPPIKRIWRAPLVPVALAVTFGIVLDRYISVPLPVSLLTAACALLAWAVARNGRQSGLALIYLTLSEAA